MKRRFDPKLLTFTLLATSAIVHADAPSTSPATAPTTLPSRDERVFLVTPAAPPASPFTYRFDFPQNEQYDGNGATAFLQAILMLPDDDLVLPLQNLNEDSSDEAFVAGVRQKATWFDTSVPDLVATAIRYHTVAYDFPVREQGIAVLLPYLNRATAMSNYLQLKARFATATGDYKQSIELIRAMFILADHTDAGETFLVSDLVTVGLARRGIDEAHRLMERPEAPNLYWALRRLPVPFGNLRRSLQSEECGFEITFPDLKDARNGQEMSAAAWKRVIDGMLGMFDRYKSLFPPLPPGSPNDIAAGRFDASLLTAARADYARRYGRTEADIARLETAQIVMSYYYHSFRDALDIELKWAALPYPQALKGLNANERLKNLKQEQPESPFVRWDGSDWIGLTRSVKLNARTDREIAATTTVEAIRAYAATHGGQFPATLADITETPPPENPATGRPFDYAVIGDSAVISDPGLWTERPLRYEVRLRK